MSSSSEQPLAKRPRRQSVGEKKYGNPYDSEDESSEPLSDPEDDDFEADSDSDSDDDSSVDLEEEVEDPEEEEEDDDDVLLWDEEEVDDEKERAEALSESRMAALKTIADLAGVEVSDKSRKLTSEAIAAARRAYFRYASLSQICQKLGVPEKSIDKVVREADSAHADILFEAKDEEDIGNAHFGGGAPVWLRRIRTDSFYACILEQAMNLQKTTSATNQALKDIPSELAEKIKKLIQKGDGDMEWVGNLTPSFVRVIGAAFLAVEKGFVSPNVDGLRSLCKENGPSEEGWKSKNRIFGYPAKDQAPKGHVKVTLSYDYEEARCIVRGFVPQSTPVRKLVEKTVQSAREANLGGGEYLEFALAVDPDTKKRIIQFGIMHGARNLVVPIRRIPKNLPIGDKNIRVTDDLLRQPRLDLRVFTAINTKSVFARKCQPKVRCDIFETFASELRNIVTSEKAREANVPPEIQEVFDQDLPSVVEAIKSSTKMRTVVEPPDVKEKWRQEIWEENKANVSGTRKKTMTLVKKIYCSAPHKPLRSLLKRYEETLIAREEDTMRHVLSRMYRFDSKRTIHVLISHPKGRWEPVIPRDSVKTWKFEK